MKKYSKIIIFAFIVVVVLSFIYASRDESESPIAIRDDSGIIFFYGQECPHCKEVEKYLEENDMREKVKFSEYEVYHNTSNANLMLEKASQCGLDKGTLGVPMLWAEGQCIIGTPDIIQFFENKTKE